MRPNRSRNHLVLVISSGKIPTTTEPHTNSGDMLHVMKFNGEEPNQQRHYRRLFLTKRRVSVTLVENQPKLATLPIHSRYREVWVYTVRLKGHLRLARRTTTQAHHPWRPDLLELSSVLMEMGRGLVCFQSKEHRRDAVLRIQHLKLRNSPATVRDKMSLIKLATLIESSKKATQELNLQGKLMDQLEWLPDSVASFNSLHTTTTT
ncbi:hypothetical protein F2Q70_00042355 [Brassica cretica]|uniref:Uncharacterized protein n=1 Tax=Brassica cretica TaxID=69181 RepID=A0A8S9KC64_BRACR|nr:hypothetical protein F2Q70_00042355 [Brassica cretica]